MADRQRTMLLDGIVFGEGPRWHDGHFYYSDIGAGTVHRVTDAGDLETVIDVPGSPSGLGWRPDGSMLIVSMHHHRLMCFSGTRLDHVADLSRWCGGDANDMVVDAAGRAYVGNIGFDLSVQPIEPKPTHLLRVDPDGSVHSVADDLVAPNGMVVTPDGETLIVAESGRARLMAFPILEGGDLGPRRVYTTLPAGAAPDGICLDAEGCVWVSSPTTNEFLRMREGGIVEDRIEAGGDRPAIACMLGGADRTTLYLITAPTASIEGSIPLRAGRIETVQVEVPGVGWP